MTYVLGGCAANSYMGIAIGDSAETFEGEAEVRRLASRARSDDALAQLELGERFEQGRGVERSVAKARTLFLRALGEGQSQNTSVPAQGAVATERTATGKAPLWPRNFDDIPAEDVVRIPALLHLCALPGAVTAECESEDVELLRGLATLESNFKDCRILSNLGGAGHNPRSFIFNAVDTERRAETRRCLLAEAPKQLSAEQASLVWAMWLAAKQHTRCGQETECELSGIRAKFAQAAREPIADSLMSFAMWDAIEDFPALPLQVGSDWWWVACRSFRSGRERPSRSEEKVCAVIRALSL